MPFDYVSMSWLHQAPVLAYTGPTSANRGSSVTLRGTLRAAATAGIPSLPLVGKTLVFTYGSAQAIGTTDETGSASATFTALSVKGSVGITVSFPGHGGWVPATVSTSLRVR